MKCIQQGRDTCVTGFIRTDFKLRRESKWVKTESIKGWKERVWAAPSAEGLNLKEQILNPRVQRDPSLNKETELWRGWVLVKARVQRRTRLGQDLVWKKQKTQSPERVKSEMGQNLPKKARPKEPVPRVKGRNFVQNRHDVNPVGFKAVSVQKRVKKSKRLNEIMFQSEALSLASVQNSTESKLFPKRNH